jgi:two-component system, response regulator RegA
MLRPDDSERVTPQSVAGNNERRARTCMAAPKRRPVLLRRNGPIIGLRRRAGGAVVKLSTPHDSAADQTAQVTSAPAMRALVVEDDTELGRAVVRALEEWGAVTSLAGTLSDAARLLEQGFELVVLDVGLPDGSGVALAERAAKLRPAPLIVVFSGAATAEEGFRLGQLGVRGYIRKPVSLSDFTATIEALLVAAPDIAPFLVAAVGREPFQNVLAQVRRTMAEQALAVSGGNRTGAARLLGVTRQAVQHLIRDMDLEQQDKSGS